MGRAATEGSSCMPPQLGQSDLAPCGWRACTTAQPRPSSCTAALTGFPRNAKCPRAKHRWVANQYSCGMPPRLRANVTIVGVAGCQVSAKPGRDEFCRETILCCRGGLARLGSDRLPSCQTNGRLWRICRPAFPVPILHESISLHRACRLANVQPNPLRRVPPLEGARL